jgi:glycosyltransferase involved in cell wall biosynthesis
VGGLNENKGCLILLQALNEINLNHKSIALHIVGDGHLKTVLEELASKLEISVKFYGAIPKDEVTKIYEICHFIVLPSQSEGFPKVIGEGMNYGCVPIVSNVSCIGQYIEHSKNGFLIETISVSNVKECLLLSLKLKNEDYKNIIKYNYGQAKKFTYSNYRNRISQEIFN